MKRLWDKGNTVDELMHRLTVGEDPLYDQALFRWDCIGSAAQAHSLNKMGILSVEETNSLLLTLKDLLTSADAGKIKIPPELEDAHTTLETLLTEKIGIAGKKLHTGRSRNDQVLLTIRLYLRQLALEWLTGLQTISDTLIHRYQELSGILMPGYTHLQPAMPSSLGMWLHAFLEGICELQQDGFTFLSQIDRCPLGASAGFGSSLPIDREFIAKLLAFSKAQPSFIDIQNSRGRYEERLLFWGVQIGTLWEKFAWDVSLYCTREFGFFSLPDHLVTGSSIMPQKKNPDLVELLRGRCAKMRGYLAQLQWIIAKLPSNYHRDLQLTKEPLFRGAQEIKNILDSVYLVIHGLQAHPHRMKQQMPAELYATYEAYRQVKEGVPFRDAYHATATLVKEGKISETGYETEIAQILKEVDHYFFKTQETLEKHKIELSTYKKKLLDMESRIFCLLTT